MAAVQKIISPRAWGELLFLALIWGGSFLSIRISLHEVGPMTYVLHRTFWGALVLWVAVAFMRLPVPRDARVWVGFAVMGVLNNVLPFTLMAWAQLHIESGLTSIFNASTAVFGVLVAALVFADETLTRRKLVGVTLGFAGVVVALGADQLHKIDLRSLAQLAVLAGTLCYAFAGVWARSRLSHLAPQVAAAGMLTSSAIMMIPLTLIFEGVPSFHLSPDVIGALFYISIIATAGAYLLYYRVLAMAGSGNLMLVTLLITPVAILLGALVLHEALPPRAYSGFALLALGLMVIDGRVLRLLRRAK